MTVTISGSTGIDKVQDGSIVQADLASGVAGNGPAFSAYLVGSQSVTQYVATKVAFDTKVFDTASCFNTSLNRFVPNVPGYYQVAGLTTVATSTSGQLSTTQIYKNGVAVSGGSVGSTGTNFYINSNTTALVYMNGTTDYLEIYLYTSFTGTLPADTNTRQQFLAFLARSA